MWSHCRQREGRKRDKGEGRGTLPRARSEAFHATREGIKRNQRGIPLPTCLSVPPPPPPRRLSLPGSDSARVSLSILQYFSGLFSRLSQYPPAAAPAAASPSCSSFFGVQLVRHERADSPSKDINSYGCRKGAEQSREGREGKGGKGCGASIRWVSTIERACWTRKFVWQVACGKSIERGSTKANAFRMLSSLNRQFRVQHWPPHPPLHPSLYCIFLLAILPCPTPCTCLSVFLPACPAVQPRANLLGTLFVAAAVDPNLQCFLFGPGHVCCACFHQLPAPATAPSLAPAPAAAVPAPTTFLSWFVVRGTF